MSQTDRMEWHGFRGPVPIGATVLFPYVLTPMHPPGSPGILILGMGHIHDRHYDQTSGDDVYEIEEVDAPSVLGMELPIAGMHTKPSLLTGIAIWSNVEDECRKARMYQPLELELLYRMMLQRIVNIDPVYASMVKQSFIPKFKGNSVNESI